MVLIIWFICRRGLTSRDDPLDSHILAQKQLGDDLLVCPSGKVIEKIDHGKPSGLARYRVLTRSCQLPSVLRLEVKETIDDPAP
jgi:hypothetical protein